MNDNEISLKELILILVRGWKIIISFTLIFILVGGISIYLMNTKSYFGQMKSDFSLSNPYITKYGTYSSTAITTETIASLLLNKDFSDSIKNKSKVNDLSLLNFSVENNKTLVVKYNSSDLETVENVLKTVQNNIDSYLNYILQMNAIDNLESYIQNDIKVYNNRITSNQILIDQFSLKLNQTPKFIETGVLNPGYDTIQRRITSIELDVIEMNQALIFFNNNYNELELNKYESFHEYSTSSQHLDEISFEINSKLSEIVIVPVLRFNFLFSLIISSILGSMFGVFVVYFIEYWKVN